MAKLDWLGSGVVFAAAMGLVGGACGSGSTPSQGPSADVSQLVDQIADAFCSIVSNCCAATGHAVPADCPTNARQQLHASINHDISATTRVNAPAASQCVAAYQAISASCPAVWDKSSFDPCDDVLQGTAPPGALCTDGCALSDQGEVVCASFASAAPDGGITTSPGICQVRVKSPAGGPCDIHVGQPMPVVHECESSSGSLCDNGTCSVPVDVGMPCTGSDCTAAAYCRGNVCEPKLAIGSTCTGNGSECVAGATCDRTALKCQAQDPYKKFCSGDYE